MTLAIVGAGFGRTGTESMRLALNRLGFGPCHHMHVVIPDPRQQAIWRDIALGSEPDWEQVFQGFGACVDWPSARYWRQLAAYYPDAKVLLTLRDAESWYTSFSKTILQILQRTQTVPKEARTPLETLTLGIIGEAAFDGRLQDRDHIIARYEEHNAAVEAAIPEGRRLTFRPGDGWEPLCAWLGVPVPDEPWPKTNTTDDFLNRVAEVERQRAQPS